MGLGRQVPVRAMIVEPEAMADGVDVEVAKPDDVADAVDIVVVVVSAIGAVDADFDVFFNPFCLFTG